MSPHLKRVLCVVNDPGTCSMIRDILSLAGCEVVTAFSFHEGLAKSAEADFDLFILDSWLPGGSGPELCRALRQSYPHARVLFYSGAAYESDRRAASEAGADAYLVNPSDVSSLFETVRRLLN